MPAFTLSTGAFFFFAVRLLALTSSDPDGLNLIPTVTWYRRAEQPIRMALWYCQNGTASILGAFFVWALSHGSPKLHVYQITFLFTGGLTLLFVPVAWFFWDEKPAKAKFLSPEDRLKAVERLKSNQTSSTSTKFRKLRMLDRTLSG